MRVEIITTERNGFECLDATQTWNVFRKNETAASALCGSIVLNSEKRRDSLLIR